MISVVMVIPSWAPESSNDRLRCARCTIFERRSPTSSTWLSIWLRSRLVRENSAATKMAVPKVTATNPTSPSTDRRTSTKYRVPRQLPANRAGNPPVAMGPHRCTVNRIRLLPWRAIASR